MDAVEVHEVAHASSTVLAGDGAGALWSGEWATALNRLEMDVESAEALLTALHQQVEEPPATLPLLAGDWARDRPTSPLPVEFADRARTLLSRQLRVSEELAHAMIESRTQIKALKKFDRPEAVARFVDTAM
jgi:hypothetical protein